MENLSTAIRNHQPLVVGSVGNRRVLQTIIDPGECDLIELRLDALGEGPEIRHFAEKHRSSHPLLLTARHPDEGGHRALSGPSRADLLRSLLPCGALIDLELRSIPELGSIWDQSAEQGLLRIASWHSFERCPSIDEMVEKVGAMHEAGAAVAKLAFRMVEPGDLPNLLGILGSDAPLPLAVMGMGPLAAASRLLAAQFGSVLNYGYLGEEATAPGQWPARLLKEAIERSGSL